MTKEVKGYLWLALTILFFSTYEIVGSTLAGGMHPLFVCAFRFTLGGIVLLPFAKLPSDSKDWWGLFFLGVLNVGLAMGLLQLSLSYTQASVAAILFSTNPLFVGIVAALAGDKLTKRNHRSANRFSGGFLIADMRASTIGRGQSLPSFQQLSSAFIHIWEGATPSGWAAPLPTAFPLFWAGLWSSCCCQSSALPCGKSPPATSFPCCTWGFSSQEWHTLPI